MYVLELAGEDDGFAAREAASACSAVEVVAPGIATARGVSPRLAGLAFTHRASELVGWCDPAVADAVALLSAATLERRGTVAVRARDVRGLAGVSTGAAERELGDVLVDRGFAVDLEDPDHELRALFAEDRCALGWLEAASVRDFGRRRPTDKPFFQPGSMDPLLARAVANLAGARPGARILDPMCGTGGVLVEAGLVGADALGVDAQVKMVRGARRNLGRYLEPGGPSAGESPAEGDDPGHGGARPRSSLPGPGGHAVVRGDATRLPLRSDAVDGATFDAPYGRQSKVEGRSRAALVAGALAEVRRVVAPGGTAVVVGDRPLSEPAREAGWRVDATFDRPVHRSLTRHVHVLA